MADSAVRMEMPIRAETTKMMILVRNFSLSSMATPLQMLILIT